jgi:hypothetical protein
MRQRLEALAEDRMVVHCLQQQLLCKAVTRSTNSNSFSEQELVRRSQCWSCSSHCWINKDWKSLAPTGILWPLIHNAWLERERWVGCREIVDEVQTEWDQAQLCLKACEKLGNIEQPEPAI